MKLPTSWSYVLLCLTVPVLWGIVSAWLFDRFRSVHSEERLAEGQHPEDHAKDMYYI